MVSAVGIFRQLPIGVLWEPRATIAGSEGNGDLTSTILGMWSKLPSHGVGEHDKWVFSAMDCA
jgi:hypothetical protein